MLVFLVSDYQQCMDDITNLQECKRRSTTDDAIFTHPPKRKCLLSGEIGSLMSENNSYLLVYHHLGSSSSVTSSIFLSHSNDAPLESPLLPENLSVHVSSSVAVNFACDLDEDDFMDLPVRRSQSHQSNPVPLDLV